MTKRGALSVVVFAVCVVIALGSAWSEEKNLWINKEVTAKIKALDPEFLKGFDVYSASVKEAPTALLFDIKGDKYHLPTRFWEGPLSQEDVIAAIRNLYDQYNNPVWDIPFEPRALNIVNLKGEVVGYVYTGVRTVRMDRKKDGSVTVYPPTLRMNDQRRLGPHDR